MAISESMNGLLKTPAGQGMHVIGIEVAGSVARSYCMVKQALCLQAEIVSGGKVPANTKAFQAIDFQPAVE